MVAGGHTITWQVLECGYKNLRTKGLKAEVGLRRLDSWIR